MVFEDKILEIMILLFSISFGVNLYFIGKPITDRFFDNDDGGTGKKQPPKPTTGKNYRR